MTTATPRAFSGDTQAEAPKFSRSDLDDAFGLQQQETAVIADHVQLEPNPGFYFDENALAVVSAAEPTPSAVPLAAETAAEPTPSAAPPAASSAADPAPSAVSSNHFGVCNTKWCRGSGFHQKIAGWSSKPQSAAPRAKVMFLSLEQVASLGNDMPVFGPTPAPKVVSFIPFAASKLTQPVFKKLTELERLNKLTEHLGLSKPRKSSMGFKQRAQSSIRTLNF